MKAFYTVLALLFTVSAAPTPVSATPEIRWKDCPSVYGPGFECGALDVPLDHADEFFRLCDEAEPRACAFAPNSAARFDALAQQILKAPLKIVLPSGREVVLLTYP